MSYKAVTIRLYPTKEQEQKMWQHVNCTRYVWNWALATWKEMYNNGERNINEYEVKKRFTAHKQENLWLFDCSSQSLAMPIINLGKSFKQFFKTKKGYPKFHNKQNSKKSFYIRADMLCFNNNLANIEKIGKVKYKTNHIIPQFKLKDRNGIKFSNPTIVYENNKWLLKYGMECENQATNLNEYAVGVDVGIKILAAVSCNGEKFVIKNVNKSARVKKREKQLKHAQRKLAKANKGSKNRVKALENVQRNYRLLSNIRKDYTHKASAKIINMLPQAIGIEDLNINGMMKNRHLSKAIAEQNLSEFLNQLEYKAKPKGINIVKADRFYPSSKTCSCCGAIKRNLKLSDRIYKCDSCGFEIDRDFNAAINLEKLAMSI